MSNQSLLEKCCLIGQPVAANPTHYMIEQAIRQAGSDWRFLTFEVGPEALEDAIRGIRALDFRGVRIVDPHREAVLAYVDQQTEHARLAGTANYLVFRDGVLVADDTLGHAAVSLLRDKKDPAAAAVVLLGAGPTARAIGAALALAGVARLEIVNRTPESAEPLAMRIADQTSVRANAVPWPKEKLTLDADVDILINATSISSKNPDELLPIDLESLRPEIVVADVAYNSPMTWILNEGSAKGCPIIDGLSVLVEQTAQALKSWSEIDADRVAMREAAEEYLGV